MKAASRNGTPSPAEYSASRPAPRPNAGFAAGNGEHPRQNRPDAGRPAKGESEAHHEGAEKAGRFVYIEPRFTREKAQPEQPEEVQAHHDNRHAGYLREHMGIGPQQGSDQRGPSPQCNKDGGEAEHEKHGRLERMPPQGRVDFAGFRQFGHGCPGEITKIGRHQRQHAGAQEGEQAGEEDHGQSEFGCHAGPIKRNPDVAAFLYPKKG